MNRRGFLKGAAAAATVGVASRKILPSAASSGRGARRLTPAAIQLPAQYEIISFFVSDQFVTNGDQNWRGVARDIANDGTIIGDTVVDGIMVPTIWDASLSASYPDLGPYQGQHAYGSRICDQGRAFGELVPPSLFMTESQAQGVDAEVTMLFWNDGQLDTNMTGSLPPDSGINTLVNPGLMLGTESKIPARWIDDVAQPLEMPSGFQTGGFRSYNAVGDTAGTLYVSEDPFTGGVPFVLLQSGELKLFDPPGGNGPEWLGRVQVFALADDLSFAAIVRGETDLLGQGYRYSNGQQTPITDLNGEGMFVRDANANGVMVGQSMLNGYSIPTMWVDGQPTAIADMIVPGPDLLFMNVEAINDSGAMVGEAQDSAGVTHHVLLRPV